LWTTNDESTRWLDVVDGLVIEQVLWNNLLDNVPSSHSELTPLSSPLNTLRRSPLRT
jgi:hypothetical protein